MKKTEYNLDSIPKSNKIKGKKYILLNMNDEVVQVTEVSYNEDTNSKFDDLLNCKLKRYIPNFYIENYGFKYEDFKDKMLNKYYLFINNYNPIKDLLFFIAFYFFFKSIILF